MGTRKGVMYRLEKWLIDKAFELKDSGVSWTQLPQALYEATGQYHKSIRTAMRRDPRYKKPIEYEDKKSYDETDVEKFINSMMALQEAASKIDTKQTKATLRIKENAPVAIAWWSDWHIGAAGTDYKLFQEDLQKIEDTEGLYFIGGGDYKDNYITGTHPGGNFEQIIKPGQQDKAVEYYMSRVEEKCLALVRGCHDDWDKRQGDKDFLETMCEVTNSVNLWHGGDLYIKLGEQTYHFKCRHKYKYESSLNTLNSMRRIMELQGPCDVAMVAHLHNPDRQDRHLMGQMRTLIRSGTYKIWDEHGQKLAGYKGKHGVPAVIIYPDRKKITSFVYLDDCITHLKAVR